MGWKKVAIGAAIVATLAGVAVPLVQAQTPTPADTGVGKTLLGGAWIAGQLTAVNGDTLTVTVNDETWQVTVDDATAFRAPGVADASVDDLTVDSQVTVRGKVTAAGEMDATQVMAGGLGGRGDGFRDGPRGGRGPMGVAPVQGEVASISADSITVKTADGDKTYALDENTRFGAAKDQDVTWEDIQVGATVMVGAGAAEGEAAKFVGVAPADGAAPMMGRGGRGFGMRGPVAVHVSGSVTAKDAASLTVETTDGVFTVQKADDTQIVGADRQTLTWDEIKVGQTVMVMGQPDPTHPIRAKGIRVLPAAPETDEQD